MPWLAVGATLLFTILVLGGIRRSSWMNIAIVSITLLALGAFIVLGLPRATATELVVQTLYGAATMLKETGEHPTVLREQVSSPAGTTMAALRQLDDHKVRAAFLTAMEAARDRSRELSSGSA